MHLSLSMVVTALSLSILTFRKIRKHKCKIRKHKCNLNLQAGFKRIDRYSCIDFSEMGAGSSPRSEVVCRSHQQ